MLGTRMLIVYTSLMFLGEFFNVPTIHFKVPHSCNDDRIQSSESQVNWLTSILIRF